MRTAGRIIGFWLVVSVAGCAGEQAQGPQALSAAPPTIASTSSQSCPLASLHGVDEIVADMNDGVAITFAAPATDVDRLRQAVRAMADASDRVGDAFVACACPAGYGGGMAERMPPSSPAPDPRSIGDSTAGGTYGPAAPAEQEATPTAPPAQPGPVPLPRSTAAVAQTQTGAVLELRPTDPTQLLALRVAVKEHIHALRRGCLGGGPDESR
jgi:hypothetical protein